MTELRCQKQQYRPPAARHRFPFPADVPADYIHSPGAVHTTRHCYARRRPLPSLRPVSSEGLPRIVSKWLIIHIIHADLTLGRRSPDFTTGTFLIKLTLNIQYESSSDLPIIFT